MMDWSLPFYDGANSRSRKRLFRMARNLVKQSPMVYRMRYLPSLIDGNAPVFIVEKCLHRWPFEYWGKIEESPEWKIR